MVGKSLEERYPYQVKVSIETGSWSDRFDWCVAMFGNFDHWMYGGTHFYFKREQDALLYALRWQ